MIESDYNLITNDIVRDAPTKKKPYTIRDGRGLFVLVHQNGSRYFQLRATVNGKRKLMQIGVYPTISIEEARLLAATRLQEAIAESGVDVGEFNLTQNPVEAPHEKPEDNNMSAPNDDQFIYPEVEDNTDDGIEPSEIGEFAEETTSKPSKTAPQVNLAYSDLVYVTKNPNKTFGQKLNEQFQLEQRLNVFQRKCVRTYIVSRAWAFTHLIRFALKLKELKARQGKITASRAKTYLQVNVVKAWIRQHSLVIVRRIDQLGKDLLSLENRFIDWMHGKERNLLSAFKSVSQSAISAIKSARGDSVEAITQVNNLSTVAASSNELGGKIYTKISKPLSLLAIWQVSLRKIILQENQSARVDDVHVYGLFAETKGNYLIYTIKMILAILLDKRG